MDIKLRQKNIDHCSSNNAIKIALKQLSKKYNFNLWIDTAKNYISLDDLDAPDRPPFICQGINLYDFYCEFMHPHTRFWFSDRGKSGLVDEILDMDFVQGIWILN